MIHEKGVIKYFKVKDITIYYCKWFTELIMAFNMKFF
jgi:hypothetical protein